jgi:hypothetical protein
MLFKKRVVHTLFDIYVFNNSEKLLSGNNETYKSIVLRMRRDEVMNYLHLFIKLSIYRQSESQ